MCAIVKPWPWWAGIWPGKSIFAKADAMAWNGAIYGKSLPLGEDLRAHEAVHLRQQERDGRFLWLARYLFSRRRRLRYEAEAYREQMRHGMTMDEAAGLLSNNYGLGLDLEDARKTLEA